MKILATILVLFLSVSAQAEESLSGVYVLTKNDCMSSIPQGGVVTLSAGDSTFAVISQAGTEEFLVGDLNSPDGAFEERYEKGGYNDGRSVFVFSSLTITSAGQSSQRIQMTFTKAQGDVLVERAINYSYHDSCVLKAL